MTWVNRVTTVTIRRPNHRGAFPSHAVAVLIFEKSLFIFRKIKEKENYQFSCLIKQNIQHIVRSFWWRYLLRTSSHDQKYLKLHVALGWGTEKVGLEDRKGIPSRKDPEGSWAESWRHSKHAWQMFYHRVNAFYWAKRFWGSSQREETHFHRSVQTQDPQPASWAQEERRHYSSAFL